MPKTHPQNVPGLRETTKAARRAVRRARKLRRTVAAGYWRHAVSGLAPSWEHEHLQDLNVDFVIDVGANRGQFTLLMHRLFPLARIVGFEPIPSAAAVYRRFAPNKAELHGVALADSAGTRQLNICQADHSSSLRPIGGLQRELFSGTEIVETMEVEVRRLDSVIQPDSIGDAALLKIDVQGSEFETLQGCGELLGRFRYVYVECSFAELYEGQALAGNVIKLLHSADFELLRVANAQNDPNDLCVQADFLFERRRKQ